VIPTSFPAATAAAFGPGACMALLPDLRGRRSPELLPSRGHPSGVPRHARVAGDRRSPLMCRGSGRGQHPGHPPSHLVLTAALGCVTAQECAAVIPLRHNQDRDALPGGGSFASIASVMARDNWCRQCDRYRTWTHNQVTAGHFGRITPIICSFNASASRGCGAHISRLWRAGCLRPGGLPQVFAREYVVIFG